MQHTFQYPFVTKYVQSPHAGRIGYIDEGLGDTTLLFVHGLSNYAMGWGKNIEFLRKYTRCIALDLPGNGLSESGNYPYSMHFFAAVVEDFIYQLGLTNICLVGHSMGAQVILTLLRHAPAIAKGLVLCAPAGFEVFTPVEVSLYKNMLRAADLFSTAENSLKQSIRSSFFTRQQDSEHMIQELIRFMHQHKVSDYRRMTDACIHGMLHEPIFDLLHQIVQPTLVIFGERDALIPNRLLHPTTTREIAEAAVAQLQNGELRMIPQCGHFLQWEHPQVVNHLIMDFIHGL